MDQNMMAFLRSILSGQGKPLSGGMQPQMQQPMAMQPMQQPLQMPATSVLPMAANEQPDHGNDGGVVPNVNPGVDDGGGNGGGGDGKGGGKGNNNARLSDFEKQMRKIANKGPKAYTQGIKKNLGMKGPATIGYGKADPSTFRTGMASALGAADPAAPATFPKPMF